jgi:hypothetical protein
VFLDENWMYANGSKSKLWSDGTSQSIKKKRPTICTRYIILHIGTQNGFVSCASLIFVSGMKYGDYKDTMNGENSGHWMWTQILTFRTYNTQLEKKRGNCLAATEVNSLHTDIFQSYIY